MAGGLELRRQAPVERDGLVGAREVGQAHAGRVGERAGRSGRCYGRAMRSWLAAGASALLAIAAPAAAAAPTWLPVTPLSEPAGYGEGVETAVNAAGAAAAAWVGAPEFGQTERLRVAIHQPGGAWTVPPSPSLAIPGIACEPHVGVDDTGAVTVVWMQLASPTTGICQGGGTPGVWAATLPPAGPRSRRRRNSRRAPCRPSSSTSRRRRRRRRRRMGGADGNDWQFRAALRPAGGAFTTAPVLDRSGYTQLAGLSASIAADGTAAIAWQEEQSGFTEVNVAAVVRPAGGAWPSFPDAITQHTNTSNLTTAIGQVALDVAPGGELTVVYGEQRTGGIAVPCGGSAGVGDVGDLHAAATGRRALAAARDGLAVRQHAGGPGARHRRQRERRGRVAGGGRVQRGGARGTPRALARGGRAAPRCLRRPRRPGSHVARGGRAPGRRRGGGLGRLQPERQGRRARDAYGSLELAADRGDRRRLGDERRRRRPRQRRRRPPQRRCGGRRASTTRVPT